MTAISRFDTAALAHLSRALVGLDRMFDTYETKFSSQNSNYPPHNIIKFDDYNYAIEMAVAGFRKEDISVEVESGQLTIKGSSQITEEEATSRQYIHKGLSSRDFERRIGLIEHMSVKNATIKDGILTINLEVEIPEEKKPRLIDIVEIK
jgi:molecular chaperone IbpA